MHGHPRFTSDLDLAVGGDEANANRLVKALKAFGFQRPELTPFLFTQPRSLVKLGVEPMKIEILNYLEGSDFNSAYERAENRSVEDFHVKLIALPDLLTNKRAVGRTKDLSDVEELEKVNAPIQR